MAAGQRLWPSVGECTEAEMDAAGKIPLTSPSSLSSLLGKPPWPEPTRARGHKYLRCSSFQSSSGIRAGQGSEALDLQANREDLVFIRVAYYDIQRTDSFPHQ